MSTSPPRLLLSCDAGRCPWWGVFWTQETREGEPGDTKGGEVKTSPTLIPLYNFILGQPMLVFCANMEPLLFPVSDGAWKDDSFTEVDLSNLKVRQYSAHILTLRSCLSSHLILCNPVDVKVGLETSLVVQWLRFYAPDAAGWGLIPGQGSRSHMPQLKMLQQGSHMVQLRPSTTK